MKKILIIANFCNSSDLNNRFFYIADMLTAKGNEVEIVTSDFNHKTKSKKSESDNGYKFIVTQIHEPGYSSNVGFKRLWSHHVWGKNVLRYLKSLEYNPDLIYCAMPSITVARLTGKLAKERGIKFITDVQDLWPEAFSLVVKNESLRNLIFKPFKSYVDGAYSYADKVIGVSETYAKRGVQPCKLGTEWLSVYLGNNAEKFDNAKHNFKVERKDGEFWIAYIGTLGYSYDIKCVIKAMQLISGDSTFPLRIKFIVMGSGPLREDFENYAKSCEVDVLFTGALPYEEMVGTMCSCDAVVNPIKKNAAQSITNKVGDYALSGLPVINTQECEEYRQLISQYECGINCANGSAEDVAEALKVLALNPVERLRMGKNSRKLGEERFDRRRTYKQIINFLNI